MQLRKKSVFLMLKSLLKKKRLPYFSTVKAYFNRFFNYLSTNLVPLAYWIVNASGYLGLENDLPKNLSKNVPKNRSSHPEVFLGKSILKIWSKFTGEHPCQSAISIKLQRHLWTAASEKTC